MNQILQLPVIRFTQEQESLICEYDNLRTRDRRSEKDNLRMEEIKQLLGMNNAEIVGHSMNIKFPPILNPR